MTYHYDSAADTLYLMHRETFHEWHKGSKTSIGESLTWWFRGLYEATGFAEITWLDFLIKVGYLVVAMPIAAPPVFRMFVTSLFTIIVNIVIWVI